MARRFLALTACLLVACGHPADKSALPARAVPVVLAPVALASHADAEHAILAGGMQDLDKVADRFMTALEQLPEPSRGQVQAYVSRPKLTEAFGFDPTKRAGWDDIGVDAAAGVFVTMDDRWPVAGGQARQVVLFVRLSDAAKWKAALAKKGAVFSQEGGVETVEVGKLTVWLAQSGQDYAMSPLTAPLTPEQKILARHAFLQIAGEPTKPLSESSGWKAAVRDAGRPWLVTWARTTELGLLANDKPTPDFAHFTKLFPQFAWWMGEGWALRVGTSTVAQQSLKDMFVPDKAAPACAALLPREGWGALRLSLHLQTFTDGLLRLVPPSTGAEERMVIAAGMTTVLAATGLPPGDVMGAWSGHVCGGMSLAMLPKLLNDEGIPDWLLVLGVQDGVKADAMLAALADRAKNQMSMQVQAATMNGQRGYVTQVGPFGIAVVRDGERIVLGPSPDAVTRALTRPAGESLASTAMADALDGRVIVGGVVDLQTAKDIALSVLQARQMDDSSAKSVSDAFTAVLGTSRLAGMALRLEESNLSLGPAGVTEGGWSGGTMVGILAAIAIPQFHKYVTLAKVAEARSNLRQIRTAAVAFWNNEQLDPKSGKILPARFPQTTLVTPGMSCCDPSVDRDGDQKCDADPTPWQQVGWQELQFQPEGPHYFRYRFESAGTGDGASFVASAYGDLDCDGIASTFQITARPCKGKACKDKWRFDEKDVAVEE